MRTKIVAIHILSSTGWIDANIVPVRGKHLDNFAFTDLVFISFSKASIAPFTFCYLKFAYEQSNIVWDIQQASLSNCLLPIPILFLVFDFFYVLFHWFLHLQSVYPYIHKHHHQQKAPSRATIDAINVHPFEFLIGEFNHLFVLYVCSTFLLKEIHLVAVLLFSAVGGILAGINHTRYDFVISIPWKGEKFIIYDSKDHDVHHRIPQSNYGQYTMFWDKLFGTHR
jgi:sterol desaturase/sphingolipid hydroxylase (fatty acid hydroxylase superfamily)